MGDSQNGSTRIAIWSLFASILLGIGTHVATWAIDRHDVQNQKIEEDIRGKLKDFESLMKVITEMRNVRFDIERECQFFPEKSHDKKFLMESSRRRNKVGYDLVMENMMADFYFGHDVGKEITLLNQWDSAFSAEEVCLKKAPTDKEYSNKQYKIDVLIRQMIKRDRAQIN